MNIRKTSRTPEQYPVEQGEPLGRYTVLLQGEHVPATELKQQRRQELATKRRLNLIYCSISISGQMVSNNLKQEKFCKFFLIKSALVLVWVRYVTEVTYAYFRMCGQSNYRVNCFPWIYMQSQFINNISILTPDLPSEQAHDVRPANSQKG